MQKKITLRKITLTAILTAISIIAFTIESLLPPLIIPGAKLGLSNIFILLILLIIGEKYAFISLVIKVILGGLFSGNISTIMYSLPSNLVALFMQIILIIFTRKLSIVTISIIGAIVNVTVQNTIFCLISKTFEFFAYLPYLSLISLFSGLLVGFTVYILINKLPNALFV